jgi:type IV secretory pathway protease TraF
MRGAVADNKMVMPVKTHRKVTEGGVFLLSDNRSFPYESRQYGSVQRETCKETVLFRLVSSRGYGDWNRRFTYIR